MKKFLVLILCFMLFFGSSSILTLKAVTTDVPMPVNYCAYSSGQTVYIQWNYSCPSGFSCYVEIEEYKSGIWDNIATVSASASLKTFSGQSYGRHQYRLRAKLTYSFITMHSSYTPGFFAHVLKAPTGLTVSVNPDSIFVEGNPYLTLKWNTVDSYATSIWVWRRVQGVDLPNLIAKISSSSTSFDDTTVAYNTTYEYTIQVICKDDTNIHDDASGFTPFVGKLTLPAPPTNYKANAIDKTVYMSWSHTKSCDGYKVYRWRTSPVIGWTLVGTLDKNTLSYNTPAPDYGVYSFKVAAYNASGDSPKAPTKDAYALRKPTGLTATPLSSTTIKLTWDSLDSNATQVRVSYSTDGVVYSSFGVFTLPVSYMTVSSLTPNTQYWFKIAVKRDSNESNYSDAATTKTLPAGVPPAAPSNLSATVLSCSKVELTWTDNSDNEDGFKIERKEGAGSFSEIATVSSNVIIFTDSTVSAEKTYTYRIRSYNSIGNSAYSSETAVNTPPCGALPNAPSNLTASLISTSEVHLKWNDNSDNEEGFKIERKTEGGTYVIVGTISANVTEADNGELLPDTKYYYRIRAYNMYGYSNYSNEVSITTPSETATPNAPSGLSATVISCSEVSLSWTDNSINETNFIIERKLEGETYQVISGTIPTNTTTYSDSNVEEGKKYYYRVKATNVNGDSAYSGEVSIVVPPCGYPPAAPSNLAVTAASTTEIQINFKDNSDNEDGFKIERKEPGGTYELIAVLSANTTSHKDSGLTPNTIYYYRVCAYNSYGTSAYSNEANAKTQQVGNPPQVPSNLTASPYSASEILLGWIDNSDNELGFKLERKQSGGTYKEIATLPENTTKYRDSGLTPNTTYYYRIIAFNNFGNSGYSSEVSATTMKEIEQIIIRLYIDKTTYYVNDSLKTMDVAPIIKESRTLLPIRYVAEALGADVAWDANERKVTITFKGTTIELWIDKNTARVNGEYKLIDSTNPKVTPVIIPPGRTMLPIRFIAENLGCKVDWDATLREVKITYPAS